MVAFVARAPETARSIMIEDKYVCRLEEEASFDEQTPSLDLAVTGCRSWTDPVVFRYVGLALAMSSALAIGTFASLVLLRFCGVLVLTLSLSSSGTSFVITKKVGSD